MDWTVRGSNTGGGEILSTRPDRPRVLPSLIYNGYRVILGVKRPGRGVYRPSTSSAEVKERVDLYLYSNTGSSWPVLGGNLPLPLGIIYMCVCVCVCVCVCTYKYKGCLINKQATCNVGLYVM